MKKNLLLWATYAVFVVVALYFNWHEQLLSFSGDQVTLKLAIWILFLAFLAYSIYCSRKENLFKTIGVMSRLHWGRQIGLDLYIGCSLALVIIYLNEGLMVALLWTLPILAFANLAVLLYFAIHFDTLADKLLG